MTDESHYCSRQGKMKERPYLVEVYLYTSWYSGEEDTKELA